MAETAFNDEITIDLKEVLNIVKKRRYLILAIFLIAVCFAAVSSFLITPTFQAETTLCIKQTNGLANSLLGQLSANNLSNKQTMSTYVEILKSRIVIEAAIQKMKSVKENPPTYEEILNSISAKPVQDTEILNIKVRAADAEDARYLANTLVDTFLEFLTVMARAEQTETRDFIEKRLAESKKELDGAEKALETYKREQRMVAPDEETRALIAKVSAIDRLKAENTVTLATSKAKMENIKGQLAQEKEEFVADSPLIQQYKSKLASLEVDLVGLLKKYTEKHPNVTETQAEIEETRSKLNTEISRVINAEAPSANPIYQELIKSKLETEAEIAAAGAQQEAIAAIVDADDLLINNLPAKEQGLVKFMRDAAIGQEIYEMLAKRFEEARISEVMEPINVQILDKAVAPKTPIKPQKKTNLMLGAMAGLFIGFVTAFMLEYFTKAINNVNDVKNYLDLPVLGSIPDFRMEKKTRNNRERLRRIS